MITTNFINSEMVAEKYIDNISNLKILLQQGKIEECLALIEKLEFSMKITLAIGERCNLGKTH